MQPIRVIKFAAGAHVAPPLAAIYSALRVNNQADLSAIAAKEVAAMAGIVLLPVLWAWIGLCLARTETARWLMAAGQTLALLLFAVTFALVMNSIEPMAPLLFVLVSMWIAIGLAALLVAVWLTGRRQPASV